MDPAQLLASFKVCATQRPDLPTRDSDGNILLSSVFLRTFKNEWQWTARCIPPHRPLSRLRKTTSVGWSKFTVIKLPLLQSTTKSTFASLRYVPNSPKRTKQSPKTARAPFNPTPRAKFNWPEKWQFLAVVVIRK